MEECYSFCSWGMHLCYKAYTSSYRVVSICSEQEKKHACLQPRDLHSILTWYQYTKCILLLEYKEKTTDLPQVTDKVYYIMLYQLQLDMNEVRTPTLVVIGTDWTGSCKFNYHTITTTTAPLNIYVLFNYHKFVLF
jgi:hypothetical protein